jgi:hypothetical protein
MPTFSRRTKIIVAFIVLIAAGYGIALFWGNRNKVPAGFTTARTQGAIIAQNIVNTSNQSTAELQQINKYDDEGDYTDALTLTNQLIASSSDLKNQAVALSGQISAMTSALSGVSDYDAQQDALEAISSRLALITNLISYSNDLDHLLTLLQGRFSGQPPAPGQVAATVNQINTDVNAINNFNVQAGQAMDKFDTIEKS